MIDFGALPPEINSGRIYFGSGSRSFTVAASAWDSLCAQLESYAAGYSSTLAELLSESWTGNASLAMSGAVAPYLEWASATAVRAGQAAAQARAAAAAFDSAFAATVAPAVVTANRMQLVVLVATNFFGQNTPGIAATEAAYAEMWAQDAVAMYTYAASSSAATALTPFVPPPHTTSAVGHAIQASSVAHAAAAPVGQTQATLSELMSAIPQQLQSLAAASSAANAAPSPAGSSLIDAFATFDTLVVNPAQPLWSTTYSAFSAGQFGTGLNLAGIQVAKAAAENAISEAGMRPVVAVRASVSAVMGNATPAGALSVPTSWVTTDPVAHHGGGSLSLSKNGIQQAPAVTNTVGGLPTARGPRSAGSLVLRNGRRAFKMPRPVSGG